MAGWLVLIVGWALIAFQAHCAHAASTFLPREMRERFPQGDIIPLAWHLGVWSDIPLTVLFAYLVRNYGALWSSDDIRVAVVMSAVLSIGLHLFVFGKGTAAEAHVHSGHVTLAGWVHAVYMTLAITVLLLTIMYLRHVAVFDLWLLALVMPLHVFLASHIVLAWFAPRGFSIKPWKDSYTWVAIIGTAAVFVACALLRSFI